MPGAPRKRSTKKISAPKTPEINEPVTGSSERFTVSKLSQFRPKSLTPILLGLLVIAAFLIGVLVTKVQYLEGGKNQPTAQISGVAQPVIAPKVSVGVGHFPVQGNKDAKVKVIEFADFQCPFCKRFFSETEPVVIKQYTDSGKIAFYFRSWPFLDLKNRDPNSTSQESTWSSEAAECANQQGKFWDFHDYLYNNQGGENSGTFTKDKLEAIAQTLGLDTTKFNSCLESDQYLAQVTQDLTEGQKAGVQGTPTTFINGRPIVGSCPSTTFDGAIKAELAGKTWGVDQNCNLVVQ